MQTSFNAALAFTKKEEGGYTDDERDSGNWSSGVCGHGSLIGSNMGVGAPALCAWMGYVVTPAMMKSLDADTYEAIARANYWMALGADDLPAGLDLMAFDYGWNRGIGTSMRLIQALVGTTPDGYRGPLTLAAIAGVTAEALLQHASLLDVENLQENLGVQIDGKLGPVTTAAFLRLSGPQALLVALSAAQERAYRQLAQFSLYGSDWLARTERRFVTAHSLALVAQG